MTEETLAKEVRTLRFIIRDLLVVVEAQLRTKDPDYQKHIHPESLLDRAQRASKGEFIS